MNLTQKKLSELKAIAAELGITPQGDKRKKTTWIKAIERALLAKNLIYFYPVAIGN